MPFIILGAVSAGVLEELVPQQLIARLIPRSRFLAIALSSLLGLVFPMCECGIVPVMRRLLRKGLPLSCCIAYMLAGPIINGVVILSTWVAFAAHENGSVTVAFRIIGGFLVAFGTAMVIEWQYKIHGDALLRPIARPQHRHVENDGDNNNGPAEKKSAWTRIGNITSTSLHDFVDITIFLIL